MTVTVKIEKNVYGGDGLCRLGDGRVCFVPGAFVGETVRAEIVEQKKRYVKARLVEIVETEGVRASPDPRLPPPETAGRIGLVYTATRWCTTRSDRAGSGCLDTGRSRSTASWTCRRTLWRATRSTPCCPP